MPVRDKHFSLSFSSVSSPFPFVIQSVFELCNPLTGLLIIQNGSRRRFPEFKLCADLLEFRCLLFELRGENLYSLFLLRDSRFLLCNYRIELSDMRLLVVDFAMRLKEFVEQHRVHLIVANAVDFAVLVAHHQVGIHLGDLFGN